MRYMWVTTTAYMVYVYLHTGSIHTAEVTYLHLTCSTHNIKNLITNVVDKNAVYYNFK